MSAPGRGLGDLTPQGRDSVGLSQVKNTHLNAHALGKYGIEHFTGNGPYTTGYCAIMATAGGCTISDISGNGTSISGATIELVEGQVLPCDIDSVTLTGGGEAIGFKRA